MASRLRSTYSVTCSLLLFTSGALVDDGAHLFRGLTGARLQVLGALAGAGGDVLTRFTAGIGALVGILYAPKAGRETREDIATGAREGTEYLKARPVRPRKR